MLEQFNRPNVKFHVIMSNGPYKPFSKDDYSEYIKDNKPMLVRSFKYLPI